MKKQYFSFLIIWFLLAFYVNLSGQNYRSHQSGAWNNAANWEKGSGSTWTYPAPEYPPLASPWITSTVTIQSGHTITATNNVGGGTNGVLMVDAGGTLQMGAYAIRGTSTSTKFPTVTINGNLNTSNYLSANTFSIGSNGVFSTSYPGLIGWWYAIYAPTSVTIQGEIDLTGASSVLPGGYDYGDIVLAGSEKQVTGDVAFSGHLTVQADASLLLNGTTLTSSGTGITINGPLDGVDSYIIFSGGTQVIDGSGTFGEAFASISLTSSANVSVTNTNLIKANNFSIEAGSAFTLSSASEMTINSSLDTNGGLTLEAATADPYVCASLIVDPSATISGNTNVKLYLTGGGDEMLEDFKWHYVSSPFTSLNVTPFTTVTQDFSQFIESRPTTQTMQGWVAYDGYIYYTGGMGGPTFSALTTGKGYNFWDDADNNLTLSGILNKSDVPVSITYAGVPEGIHGYNLIGNPFTAGLNWDVITSDLSYPADVSRGISFTRNNTECSYAGGVGNPGDVTGIIPPMQGFFVKSTANGTLTLLAEARTHTAIHQRYKGPADIPLVRLSVSETTDIKDQTVIRFDELAKTYFDNDFDAQKMFLKSSITTIHSVSDGTKFSINGQPFPDDGTVAQIPVILNLTTDGIHKISASQIQGLDNYRIMLKDNTTGLTTDLKTTPEVSFSAPAGPSDRFVLRVSNMMTSIDNPIVPDNAFSIYNAYGFITVLPLTDRWNGLKGSVRIYDISGKMIDNLSNVDFYKNSPLLIKSPSVSGLFIIEIRSGILRHTGKVVVN